MKFSWTIGLAVVGMLLLGGCEKSVTTAAPQSIHQDASVPTKVQPKLPTIKVWVGAEELVTEMALTGEQQMTGMMWRTNMPENTAMIFVHSTSQQAGYWMKNCYVPLSVAYIDPDGVIEEIHPLQVQDTNTVYSTATNIRFALETPQGWFDTHHVTTGMVIRTERGTLLETFGQHQ